MSWSAPMTAVAGSVFTANQYNTYVRDNLLETGVAKVETSGQYLVATGVNSVEARTPNTQRVDVAESTTSTSFADITTAGPSVTVDTGTHAMVFFSASMRNSVTEAATFVGYTISGATSVGADNSFAIALDGVRAGDANRWGQTHIWTSLTPGTNTFTMKYKVGSGTGTFNARSITVLPF